MRKKARNLGRLAAALGLMMSMTGMTVMAEGSPVIFIGEAAGKEGGAGQGENGPAEQPGQALPGQHLDIDVEKLSAAEKTDQIVVVAGSGMDSPLVRTAYYRKDESGSWQEIFCVSGYCGFNGMSTDKREGDRRTPVGEYGFVCNFGILPDPGSVLPYKELDEHDFWVDDSGSPYYNQMVSTRQVAPDWNSAEALIKAAPSYNYVLALDYNTAERTPGKGSAIFLHGIHPQKTWTEGCIAIPEERVKELVQELRPEARIVIMPELPLAEAEPLPPEAQPE